LKGYTENQGGVVLAAITLKGKPHSAKLEPTAQRSQELTLQRGKEPKHWWIERFSLGFDALTDPEARHANY
jgi:hypothetical protein